MFRAVSLQHNAATGLSPEVKAESAGRAPELEDSETGSSFIGEFQAGPGLRECSKPVFRFLRHWSLRPLSVWQHDLVGRGWLPWQASLVIRIAAFLWFVAGHVAIGLLIAAILWVLGALAGNRLT